MRAMLLLSLAMLLDRDASASAVLHLPNGQPGIVATSGFTAEAALDSSGRVWDTHDPGWVRRPEFDPPFPISEIAFWERTAFLTTDNEHFMLDGDTWVSSGTWPGHTAEVAEGLSDLTPRAVPNPTIGETTLSFSLDSPSIVSAGSSTRPDAPSATSSTSRSPPASTASPGTAVAIEARRCRPGSTSRACG